MDPGCSGQPRTGDLDGGKGDGMVQVAQLRARRANRSLHRWYNERIIRIPFSNEERQEGKGIDQDPADDLVIAQDLVKGCHRPRDDGKFHLGVAGAVAAPVDPGIEDIHPLPIKISGHRGVIAFPPGFTDPSIDRPPDIERPDPGAAKEQTQKNDIRSLQVVPAGLGQMRSSSPAVII